MAEMPVPDWRGSWIELRGYVQEAIDDGGTIDPADLAAYMDELKERTVEPMDEWLKRIMREAGESDG